MTSFDTKYIAIYDVQSLGTIGIMLWQLVTKHKTE